MMGLEGINLDDVQVKPDFGAAKAGNYRLRVAEIEAKQDQAGRDTIQVRHEFITPEAVETIDGNPVGGIFNTLYLHKQEALGFLRRFVEAHGVTWDAFKSNRDLAQFVGAEAEAYITCETVNGKTGEALSSPRNRVGKYLLPKA